MSCEGCSKRSVFDTAKAVLEGTTNFVFKSEEIEAIAKPRIKSCLECKYSRELARLGNKRIFDCTVCNCLIELKARVKEEHCPKGRW